MESPTTVEWLALIYSLQKEHVGFTNKNNTERSPGAPQVAAATAPGSLHSYWGRRSTRGDLRQLPLLLFQGVF